MISSRVINVNLIGTFNAMRLAAHAMSTLDPLEDGERGVIVSTASVAAYDGQIGQAAYAASKGGVARDDAAGRPRARAVRHQACCGIAPGIFGTPMVSGMSEEVQQSLAASIPFPKALGRPEQYADLALHIIENRYLNGEVIRLDGAIRMAPREAMLDQPHHA